MTNQFDSAPPAWSSIFQAEEVAPTVIRQPGAGTAVAVTTVLRQELAWPPDAAVPDSYGNTPNKLRLHLDGELLYPEFIIVRLLEHEHWSVGWMNNWKRTFERSMGEPVKIPEHIEQLLSHIGACTGKGDVAAGIWSAGRETRLRSLNPSNGARTRYEKPKVSG